MDGVDGGWGLEEKQGSEQSEGRREGSSGRECSTNKGNTKQDKNRRFKIWRTGK